MELTLRRLKPGILLAVGVALVAGLAVALSKAIDVDLELGSETESDWLGIGA